LKIEPFALERYFDRHEFSARYLLSCSDCEPFSLARLLELADDESRQLWRDLSLGYTQTAGHPALRQAVAGTYQGVDPEDVMVVVPEEGVFLFMQAALEPGDHVVCTFPGYQSLYALARAIGCDVSLWTPEEGPGWRFSLAALERLIKNETRLVVVNFPHNPTGALPTRDELTALVELVEGCGARLFSDEMYRLLELDGAATLPAACELHPRAVTLSGLSKSFGLPGLRVGWLATRDRELLRRVAEIKDYTTICASAPSEVLALAALGARDVIIGEQRARLARNLEALDVFMRSHQDRLRWGRPQAGSICFPRLLATEGAERFCQTLVEEAGIMLVPSSLFEYGDGHVRVGFGREGFPQVLERFAEYLDGQVRRG
jgi:aspartate/methionine/tyrosine aminotransferase